MKIGLLLGIHLFATLDSAFAQDFVTRGADSLRFHGQRFYMRGAGMANYFLLDVTDGSWDTEGFDTPWPSPDEDVPLEFTEAAQYSAGNFLDAAAMGFNVIRISMTYRHFEDNSKPGRPYKPAGFDLLRDYVRWAKAAGILIILDMHLPQGGLFGGSDLWESTAARKRFVNLWTAIADTFKNETSIAAYDILNEPHPTSGITDSEGDNAQWKALANEVVDSIRTVDTNHLIIVEGVNFVTGDGDRDLDDLDRYLIAISDDNFMIDWHFYWPEAYIFEAIPNEYPSNKKVLSLDRSTYSFDLTFLLRETEYIKDFAAQMGVPLNFGEWSGKADIRKGGNRYKRDCILAFQANDVHWQYWNLNNLYVGNDPRNIADWGIDWLSLLAEIRVFLGGAFDNSTAEMTTLLSSGGCLPTTSPYLQDQRSVSNIPEDLTDWVLVQLRATPSGPVVASTSAFLHKDGRIIGSEGTGDYIVVSAPPGNYYIVIQHRNHLAAMTRAPVDFLDGMASYDFTTSSSQYFGSRAAKQLAPNLWGMWPGDINQDGEVTTSDYTQWFNDDQLSASDYQLSDQNLDAQVNISDYAHWFNSAAAGASSAVPELEPGTAPSRLMRGNERRRK